VLQRGRGRANNQPGQWHVINGHFCSCIEVVAVIAFWWFWLVVEVASLFPVVVLSFPAVAWFLWLVVAVALLFPKFALWLLQLIRFPQLSCRFSRCILRLWLVVTFVSILHLHGHFLWLRHGSCSHCVSVVVDCLSWLMFPTVVSSFPMVASWLLQLLCLAVVFGCLGCHHCHGCFCGCCARSCWLLWLMILVVAVVSCSSVDVSLAPVCVQFCSQANCFCCHQKLLLLSWTALQNSCNCLLQWMVAYSDVPIIIFSG